MPLSCFKKEKKKTKQNSSIEILFINDRKRYHFILFEL